MKSKLNKLYSIADEITADIKKFLEKQHDKFYRFNEDMDIVYGFPLHGDVFEETPILALAIFDNEVSAYMPPVGLVDFEISDEELLEGGWWYTLDKFSEMYFLQTIANIADAIPEVS